MFQSIYYDFKSRTCHLRDDGEGWNHFTYKRTGYALDSNGKYLTLDEKKVKPVTKFESRDPRIFESDVDMSLAVLLDLYRDSDDTPSFHNRLFFDIETEIGGAINLEYCQEAPSKIMSVALYDDNLQEYYCYFLDETKTVKESTKDNVRIIPCSNEHILLLKVLEKWTEIDPTIIIGWNSDGFDIPYLYNRMKKIIGEDRASQLSPLGIVEFDEYNKFKCPYQIRGINSLDYMRLYKKFIPKGEPSYALGAIGEKEVNRSKITYEGNLNNLFHDDINKFIEYNINDVKIIVELDLKKKFIDLTMMICHMAHVPYHYIYQSSRVIEGAIMTYLKRKGIVSPNKPTTMNLSLQSASLDEEDDKFAGAYVKDPIPGLYGWNCDLDLESLYPSLGILLNIGIETFMFKILVNDKFDDTWNLADLKLKENENVEIENIGGRRRDVKLSEIIELIEKNDFLIAPNGVVFDSSHESILSEVMNHWFKKRKDFKTSMIKFGKDGDKDKYDLYDRYQQVMKIFLNSIYGVMGLKSFRYSDGNDHLASAITSAGRLTIMKSADWVNDKINLETNKSQDYIMMSDTDSLYVAVEDILSKRYPTLDLNNDDEVVPKIHTIAKEYEKELNEYYQSFTKDRFNSINNRLKTKSETVGKKIYISAKKQYAQLIIDKEGVKMSGDDRFDFKGLDYMKSSYPRLFKDFLQQLIKDILLDKNKNYIDEEILGFRERYKTLPLIETAKPTGINKLREYIKSKPKAGMIFSSILPAAPVNTKAAIFYNDLLKFKSLDKKHPMIQIGDKMKWIYLKDNPYKIEVLGFNSYSPAPEILKFIEEYMDREKMFSSVLVNKLQKIYDNIGWGAINFNKNTKKFFYYE